MNKLIILLILFGCSLNVFGADFECDQFYLNPSNTLGGASIFEARYVGDKYSAELAPSSEAQKSNIITQYWQLDPYKDKSNKLFVKCIYENNADLIKQIPIHINICRLKFYDNQKNSQSILKPNFRCYQRGEKDGKYSPKA